MHPQLHSTTRKTFLRRAAAGASAAALWPNIANAQASTVKIGVLRIMSDGPFYVTDKKGYWKDEGLSVEFLTFASSGDMVVPFEQGSLDAGGGTPAAGLYNGVARGLASRLVADRGTDAKGYGFDKLMVRADHVKSGRYKSPKDLKGMTIAGNEAGSGSSAALYFLLQQHGLGWGDVTRERLAFPAHVAALANGKVDASYTAEPACTLAIRQGSAVAVMGDDEWYPNQQLSALLYGGAFLKKPDIAYKFMRGYLRGARFFYGALKNGKLAGPNGSDVIAIFEESMPQKEGSVYKDATPASIDPDLKLQVANMKRDLDYFRGQKLIESTTIGVNDIIESSFVNRAVKELGPYKGPRA